MSKTMTRFLSLLLIAVLAISLCGCGGEGKKTESNQSKLEDYELLYKDACIMTDSDGNDAVVDAGLYKQQQGIGVVHLEHQ